MEFLLDFVCGGMEKLKILDSGTGLVRVVVGYYYKPVVSLEANSINTSLGKDSNGAWQIKKQQ